MRMYLKRVHKKLAHRCKLQIKEGDMWESFERCMEYSKDHSYDWRELYLKKYGIDWRKRKGL